MTSWQRPGIRTALAVLTLIGLEKEGRAVVPAELNRAISAHGELPGLLGEYKFNESDFSNLTRELAETHRNRSLADQIADCQERGRSATDEAVTDSLYCLLEVDRRVSFLTNQEGASATAHHMRPRLGAVARKLAFASAPSDATRLSVFAPLLLHSVVEDHPRSAPSVGAGATSLVTLRDSAAVEMSSLCRTVGHAGDVAVHPRRAVEAVPLCLYALDCSTDEQTTATLRQALHNVLVRLTHEAESLPLLGPDGSAFEEIVSALATVAHWQRRTSQPDNELGWRAHYAALQVTIAKEISLNGSTVPQATSETAAQTVQEQIHDLRGRRHFATGPIRFLHRVVEVGCAENDLYGAPLALMLESGLRHVAGRLQPHRALAESVRGYLAGDPNDLARLRSAFRLLAATANPEEANGLDQVCVSLAGMSALTELSQLCQLISSRKGDLAAALQRDEGQRAAPSLFRFGEAMKLQAGALEPDAVPSSVRLPPNQFLHYSSFQAATMLLETKKGALDEHKRSLSDQAVESHSTRRALHIVRSERELAQRARLQTQSRIRALDEELTLLSQKRSSCLHEVETARAGLQGDMQRWARILAWDDIVRFDRLLVKPSHAPLVYRNIAKTSIVDIAVRERPPLRLEQHETMEITARGKWSPDQRLSRMIRKNGPFFVGPDGYDQQWAGVKSLSDTSQVSESRTRSKNTTTTHAGFLPFAKTLTDQAKSYDRLEVKVAASTAEVLMALFNQPHTSTAEDESESRSRQKGWAEEERTTTATYSPLLFDDLPKPNSAAGALLVWVVKADETSLDKTLAVFSASDVRDVHLNFECDADVYFVVNDLQVDDSEVPGGEDRGHLEVNWRVHSKTTRQELADYVSGFLASDEGAEGANFQKTLSRNLADQFNMPLAKAESICHPANSWEQACRLLSSLDERRRSLESDLEACRAEKQTRTWQIEHSSATEQELSREELAGVASSGCAAAVDEAATDLARFLHLHYLPILRLKAPDTLSSIRRDENLQKSLNSALVGMWSSDPTDILVRAANRVLHVVHEIESKNHTTNRLSTRVLDIAFLKRETRHETSGLPLCVADQQLSDRIWEAARQSDKICFELTRDILSRIQGLSEEGQSRYAVRLPTLKNISVMLVTSQGGPSGEFPANIGIRIGGPWHFYDGQNSLSAQPKPSFTNQGQARVQLAERTPDDAARGFFLQSGEMPELCGASPFATYELDFSRCPPGLAQDLLRSAEALVLVMVVESMLGQTEQ